MKEGIHQIPDAEYFAIDLPSSSATKLLLEGPNAVLGHRLDNPDDDADTDALTVGSYAHALVFQPHEIDRLFLRLPKMDRRTTEGRAAYDAALRRAERNGVRIVTEQQASLAQAMANAVLAHAGARRLLTIVNRREITIIGRVAGHLAKCKVDAARLDEPREDAGPDDDAPGAILIDLKTSEDASPRAFAASAAKYGYFHQAAWYSTLVESLGWRVDEFAIIAVEKSPPHLVAVYSIDGDAKEIAAQRFPTLLERWDRVKSGDRTGYSDRTETLHPPTWWVEEQDRNANR